MILKSPEPDEVSGIFHVRPRTPQPAAARHESQRTTMRQATVTAATRQRRQRRQQRRRQRRQRRRRAAAAESRTFFNTRPKVPQTEPHARPVRRKTQQTGRIPRPENPSGELRSPPARDVFSSSGRAQIPAATDRGTSVARR